MSGRPCARARASCRSRRGGPRVAPVEMRSSWTVAPGTLGSAVGPEFVECGWRDTAGVLVPSPEPGSDGLRVGRRIALACSSGRSRLSRRCSAHRRPGWFDWRGTSSCSTSRTWPRPRCAGGRGRSRARARRAWRLLAIALVLSVAGNVCMSSSLTRSRADVVDDQRLLYLATYPVHEHRRDAAGARTRAATSCPPSGWTGWSSASASPRSSRRWSWRRCMRLEPPVSAQAVTNLAYPMADLTLLVVLATVGGVTGLRLDPRLALLGSGAGHSRSSPTSPTSCSTWPARYREGESARPRLAAGPAAHRRRGLSPARTEPPAPRTPHTAPISGPRSPRPTVAALAALRGTPY